jgi:hypothetical protein
VLTGRLNFTHEGSCGMLHEHSRSVWMRTVLVPPAALIEDEPTSRVTPHLPASGVGERTVVDEDPHPSETPPRSVMNANAEASRYRAMGAASLQAGRQRASSTALFDTRVRRVRRECEHHVRGFAAN